MDIKRREFLAKTTLTGAGIVLGASALSAKTYRNISGANDRINVAVVGLGRRYGGFIQPISKKENNIRLVSLCDVMESQRTKAAKKFAPWIDNKPSLDNDIRKVLEDKNLDAIFNLTPDHWHAPGSIMAMKAGKHVYVEKPVTHNMQENIAITEAARKYNKFVQAGTQQRSAPHTIQIIDEIHKGLIGETYRAVAFYSNRRGEVPLQKAAAVPKGLDWDLFQGPAPRKGYTEETWDYNWHWYGWDYGTAEAGNNGTHEMDVARWALQVDIPNRVDTFATKGHFPNDGWEMYDSIEATYRFGNKTITWDGKSRNGYNTYGSDRGVLIYGSEGVVFVNRSKYIVYNRGGEVIRDSGNVSNESGTALGGGGDMTTLHAENLFNAIRGNGKLHAPIDEAVLSAALVNYTNVSYRIDSGFDVAKDGKIKDPEGMKLWGRSYEKGWELESIG